MCKFHDKVGNKHMKLTDDRCCICKVFGADQATCMPMSGCVAFVMFCKEYRYK